MIAPAMPVRQGNGMAMRLGQFLQALACDFEVDLIVAPVAGMITVEGARWAQSVAARLSVLDTEATLDTHLALIMQLADPEERADAFARLGLPSLSGRLSTTAILRCREIIGNQAYDLIHASRSYCARLALGLRNSRPAFSLDLDEDDERVFSAIATLDALRGRAEFSAWRHLEARAFKNLVDAAIPHFDRVWVASAVDAARLGGLAVIPNAIEAVPRPQRRDDGRTLLFVGSLGYEPNEDAVEWFLSAVWPRLRTSGPPLQLRIVGPDASEGLRLVAREAGAEIVGWAENLRAQYETSTLSIAPVRAGAGTRIKLLEAAVHRVPIVSTTLGAEGLGMEDGCHLWLADNPADFSAAIEQALSRPAERLRRARAARAWVAEHFDRGVVVAHLAAEFRALL